MSEYIAVFLWLALMAVVIEATQAYRYENVLGRCVRRVTPAMALLLFMPVIWIAANRGGIMDTALYLSNYDTIPSSFKEIPGYLGTVKKDRGFYLLSAVIRCLGANRFGYLFAIAFFQGCVVVWFFRRYALDYVTCVFVFLASTDYISWMFNGMRQFMAVVILLTATELMIKKKYIPLLFVILLASTMHQSALLMLPLVLIAQGKAWNGKTILFIFGVILATSYAEQFTTILDNVMQETQYATMVSDWIEWQDNGTNPLRVLVYSIPTLLSLIGIRYIREADNPLVNFCTNMSIYSTGMYAISMMTSGIYMGRLPIYGSMYGILVLTWEIDYMFTKRTARAVRMIMIVAYMLFYYYQMHSIWGLI